MASAMDEFRAQRELVEAVHAQLKEVSELLRSIRQETAALAHDQGLRKLLTEEQTWLSRAQDLVRQVQYFRQTETNRFWPAVWRRWAVATALVIASAVAAGAGYAWTGRPYEREMESLRRRAEFGDTVVERIVRLTAGERRQFELLMKWNETPGR